MIKISSILIIWKMKIVERMNSNSSQILLMKVKTKKTLLTKKRVLEMNQTTPKTEGKEKEKPKKKQQAKKEKEKKKL